MVVALDFKSICAYVLGVSHQARYYCIEPTDDGQIIYHQSFGFLQARSALVSGSILR
jgi:hypothetical protein